MALRNIRRTLFAPAVSLLNRLTYPRKFALLSCVLLLPLGVALLSLLAEMQQQIDFARAERQGLALLRPMQAYNVEVLRHLDSSRRTALLQTSWQLLQRAEAPLSQRFGTGDILNELGRSHADPNQHGELKINVRDRLEQLRVKIGSTSNLILDPVTDSYYLVDALLYRLPRIQTDLALIARLIREEGQPLTPVTRSRLIALADDLRDLSASLEKNLDTASRANRGGRFAYTLHPAFDRLDDDLDNIILPLELLAFPQLQIDLAAIGLNSEAALQASDLYWQRTASELDLLLQQRVEALQRRQWSLGLFVLFTLLLALYLFVGFYRSIMQTVERLRLASRRMVEGTHSGAVELESADEMAMVVRSFNSVADALRQAEANYRSIVENALEGIFQTTPAGRFRMANPTLARLLGYDTPEQLIAAVAEIGADLYVDPRRRERFLSVMAAEGAVMGFESQVRRRDGSLIWISESARAVRDGSDAITAFEGTVIDVTQRRRDAEEIARLTEELKDENLRLGAELSVTRRLQDMLMPSAGELGAVPGLDIAGYMEPADEVGGDYYDIQQAHGRVRFSIGDVTGHGLESSLVMIMAQTAVRTLVSNGETDPARLLNAVNRTIYDNTRRMGSAKNMTLSLLEYDAGTLRLCGQHEELIIVRASGEVEQVDTFELGFPLGLESDISRFVKEAQLRFDPGDVALLYTDGITEAMNRQREQYGIDRMVAVVRARREQAALGICEAIVADLRAWIAPERLFDDITLLVLKQVPQPLSAPL
ncbi:MAG: SpoIIE family protein phosphatase [Vulcanococcus sp.]